MGEREHVEELELVVEVVLEPEHHLEVVAERLEELPVAPLERGEQRLPAAPAAVGEEAGACAQQLLPWQRRHRPLVEHVLPGQHGTAERGLPQGVAGALAVGDVEERRPRRRRAAAADEVGGAAGAVVERGAGAADDARELIAHTPQRRDPRVDLVDLRRHSHPQRLRRRSRAACRAQILGDLRQREADGLRLLDRAEEANRLLVVAAVPARRAIRRRQQAPPLVVAQRLDVYSCAFRDLANSHATDYRPVPRYGNQRTSAETDLRSPTSRSVSGADR